MIRSSVAATIPSNDWPFLPARLSWGPADLPAKVLGGWWFQPITLE